jgi:pimeloyl-ACP methyl ester carboxylesterase
VCYSRRLVVWADQLTTRLRAGVVACCAMWLRSLPGPHVTAYWRLLARHDQSGALRVLARAEVLILVGEKDRITPVRAARDLESQIPGARLFIARSTGHSLPRCRAADIAGFLSELLHGRRAPTRRAPDPVSGRACETGAEWVMPSV